jgi:hypothetical protein
VLGFGDAIGAVHAAGAADIFDNHRLAEHLSHPLREQTRWDIVGTTGGKGIDHRQRARRPFLRRCLVTSECVQGNHGDQK